MATITRLHFEGDSDDLLRRKQEHVDPVTARVAPGAGGLVHVTAKTPEGLLVINVMEDAEDTGEVATHPDVAAALRASGLPQPRREHYPVQRFVVAPSASAATT